MALNVRSYATIMSLNRDTYLREVARLILALNELDKRTLYDSSIYHRLIGSVVESIKCFLAGIANSLDESVDPEKAFKATYIDDEDLSNVIKLSHRTYLNQLHATCSRVFKEFCVNFKIEVSNSIKLGIEKKAERLKEELPTDFHIKIDDFVVKLLPKYPQFNDYLESIFKFKELSKEVKSNWRKFFNGFSLLRNKVSHESSVLTQNEIQVIRESGIGVKLSENEFLVNFRIYNELAISVLDFIDIMNDTPDHHIR